MINTAYASQQNQGMPGFSHLLTLDDALDRALQIFDRFDESAEFDDPKVHVEAVSPTIVTISFTSLVLGDGAHVEDRVTFSVQDESSSDEFDFFLWWILVLVHHTPLLGAEQVHEFARSGTFPGMDDVGEPRVEVSP